MLTRGRWPGSLQRMVRPPVSACWRAWKNPLRALRCIGDRKYGTPSTRSSGPSLERVLSDEGAVGRARSSADKMEPSRSETSKPVAEIPVSLLDRLAVVVCPPEDGNSAQIAIATCSQRQRLKPLALLWLGVPATMLLERLPLPPVLRTLLWTLWIGGTALWFLAIPLMVRVPCAWWPNDPSSATRPAGRGDCNSDAMAGFAAAHG